MYPIYKTFVPPEQLTFSYALSDEGGIGVCVRELAPRRFVRVIRRPKPLSRSNGRTRNASFFDPLAGSTGWAAQQQKRVSTKFKKWRQIEMGTTQAPAIDMNKLNAFIGQFVTDLGATVHTGMVVIGEKLGLYKALAGGPMSSAQLAAKTKTDERYLREWLASQAAGGYITYDDTTGKFSLSEEQAFTLV